MFMNGIVVFRRYRIYGSAQMVLFQRGLGLHSFFSHDVAGHSLRAGGATWLAMSGVSVDLIQAIGRWTSSSFKIYIKTHPVLLTAIHFPTPQP
jgi:hypothetical protein